MLPRKVNETQVKSNVEKLWQYAKKTIVSGIDSSTELNIKDELRHSTQSFLNSAKNICNTNVNQNYHKTLTNLKKDKSIKVCSYDKGNGIVIVNSKDYYEKLDTIILDDSKFKEVPAPNSKSNPVIRNEKNIRDYLRSNLHGKISQQDFDRIYPSGSQPGKLYGLCKVHKDGMPFRPVVSMLNTAEYYLAKYLDSIIKPHLASEFMLDSTASFLDRLKTFIFKPNDILVSFDVVSLFTNVPLTETIDMIADDIYKSKNKPNFEKEVFIELMKMATSGIFLYNGKYYKQIDGVTMGSPLGPTMANFCMSYHERRLLKSNNKSCTPPLYLRYVDDIFCVFRGSLRHEDFLNKLNAMHKNIKFTSEVGNDSLAFLDTYIELPKTEADSVKCSVYRKKTYTSLIMNFSAVCPSKWKIGLIQCLLHRAYQISSNWTIMSIESNF